jgi:hypothetical protein
MAKIMHLYNMSFPEASRLSDAQVQTMLEHAQNTAASLLPSHPAFQAALAPVKAAATKAASDPAKP